MADLLTIQNFIGGRFVDCEEYIDSYDPSVGRPHARIPDSGKKEIDMAVQAAKEAFKRSNFSESMLFFKSASSLCIS